MSVNAEELPGHGKGGVCWEGMGYRNMTVGGHTAMSGYAKMKTIQDWDNYYSIAQAAESGQPLEGYESMGQDGVLTRDIGQWPMTQNVKNIPSGFPEADVVG